MNHISDNKSSKDAIGVNLPDFSESERLRMLTEVSSEGVFIHEMGVVVDANSACSRILGYSLDELMGRNLLDFAVHPDDVSMVRAQIIKGATTPYEIRAIHADGHIIPTEVQAINHVIGTRRLRAVAVRDITARKRSEAALQEREILWNKIIDTSPDGIVIIGLDGAVQLASDRAAEIFGRATEKALIGQNLFDLLDPSSHDDAIQHMRELVLGVTNRAIEHRIRRPDGSTVLCEANANVLSDAAGEPTGILFVERDITERKTAERALIESEEKFRIITETVSDVIWVLNITRQCFTYISPTITDLRGITVEEALSETLDQSMTPASMELVTREIERALSHLISNPSDNAVYYNEIQQPHKNGTLIWVEVSTKFRMNADQEIEVVGVSRNIEARKALENELRMAKRAAEQASNAKSAFLANMSHEIRTPLNGVIGFTELLGTTQLSRRQREYVKNANASAHLLLGIISDILDFSKIEAGKLELDPIVASLPDLLTNTLDIIRFGAENKGLQLYLNVPDSLPEMVLFDPIRLKQVLVNLMGNAVKFTARGSVTLHIEYESLPEAGAGTPVVSSEAGAGTPVVSSEAGAALSRGARFTFRVTDTGIGIHSDQLGNLFKAFSQGDSSTTRRFGGTGLGLIISSNLVHLMGSSIQVRSTPEQGSEFHFSIVTKVLQAADWAAQDSARHYNNRLKSGSWSNSMPSEMESDISELSSDSPRSGELISISNSNNVVSADHPLRQSLTALTNVQIMVVEDVPMNTLLLKNLIHHLIPGARVQTAENGRIALEQLKTLRPDIILMDIQMPELDGYDTTRAIRAKEGSLSGATPAVDSSAIGVTPAVDSPAIGATPAVDSSAIGATPAVDSSAIALAPSDTPRIPIVALTAGVVKGERDKCQAAGMDAFLSKPIDVAALIKVFCNFLVNADVTVTTQTPYRNASSMDDTAHFDKARLIERTGNDVEFVEELLLVALVDFEKHMELLSQAISESNHELIWKTAHALKGSSRTICFDQMAVLTETLEKAGKSSAGNYESLVKLIHEEWAHISRVIHSGSDVI